MRKGGAEKGFESSFVLVLLYPAGREEERFSF